MIFSSSTTALAATSEAVQAAYAQFKMLINGKEEKRGFLCFAVSIANPASKRSGV
jgi:hypothetical protein